MISTLQKRLQYALLSLVGPSSSFRIGSHIGRDTTTLQDAVELVRTREAYQFHSKRAHLPAQALQTIPLSWPFSVWGSISSAPSPERSGALNSCSLPSTS